MQTWTEYLMSYFGEETEGKRRYPVKENRYYSLGWNGQHQECYTGEDVELINKIKTKYDSLEDKTANFDLEKDSRLYGLWQCEAPAIKHYSGESFTLPNRESKDAASFPLWEFSDNMARQIANWQSDRTKYQNPALMNDPIMLALDELKHWFFDVLSVKECKPEVLEQIAKRQSYIKFLSHYAPNFGPDRKHLYEIQHRLDDATMIVKSCIANKQLPDLLSDAINQATSLTKTMFTYLHLLATDEEVADNFSQDFVERSEENLDISPISKIYHNANLDNPNESAVSQYKPFNKFFSLSKVAEEKGEVTYHLQLKNHLLNDIAFPDFLTDEVKQNYIEVAATLETLLGIKKTFEQFRSLQAKLGTYHFAINYHQQFNQLAENQRHLIFKSQKLLQNLVSETNKGFEKILSSANYDPQKYQNFQKNLRALDTLFSQETTTAIQLDNGCEKTITSTDHYREAMEKLVTQFNEGKAVSEVNAEMDKLAAEMNYINSFIEAQLKDENTLRIKPRLQLTPGTKLGGQLVKYVDNLIEARWDKKIKYHPITNQPIYTHRLFKDGKEIGSAEYYGQKYLCKTPDGKGHNILKTTGVLNNFPLNKDMSLVEICQNLPPSMFDKVFYAAIDGAKHGFLSGCAEVLAVSLKSHGMNRMSARALSRLAYYGGLYVMSFHRYYQQTQEELQAANTYKALIAAAVDTGSIFLINCALSAASTAVAITGRYLRDSWPRLSKFIVATSNLLPLSIAGYYATTTPETAAAIASGIAADVATEKIGKKIVKRM